MSHNASRHRSLSQPGLPRPRTPDGQYPIPWNADPSRLGIRDRKRTRRTAGGWVCMTCGTRLDPEQPAYLCAYVDDEHLGVARPGDCLPNDLGVHAMDHGLLDERCLRLSLAACPELRRLRHEGRLLVCEVPPGSIEAYGRDARVVAA